MHLNIFSQSALLAGAAQKNKQTINTRFGELAAVNDKYSKYTTNVGGRTVNLVERIDLSDLFKDIEQDISEVVYDKSVEFVDITSKLGVDISSVEGPFIEEFATPSEDELGDLFNTWVSFVGLTALHRQEVGLSIADGYLYVDARRSLLFKGEVRVKYKKDE